MDNTDNVKLLDLELLREDDISDYDLERTEFIVYKWFKNYRKLQRTLTGGPQLLPSSQYKMVWVDESRRGINNYSSLDKYIDDKTEYFKYAQILKYISDNISIEENVYMTICYLMKKSERRAAEEIGCARNTIINVRNSFIVYFPYGKSFDVAYYVSIFTIIGAVILTIFQFVNKTNGWDKVLLFYILGFIGFFTNKENRKKQKENNK